MNTKGISPLIATVLIIGFTVALAAVIITWGGRFIQQTQEDVDKSTQVGLTCSRLSFEIAKVECALNGDLTQLTINSNTNENIAGFTFRATDAAGVLVDDDSAEDSLTGFDSDVYVWNPSGDTGVTNNATRLEAIAHVSVSGDNQVCQAGIEKLETSNVCGFTN